MTRNQITMSAELYQTIATYLCQSLEMSMIWTASRELLEESLNVFYDRKDFGRVTILV